MHHHLMYLRYLVRHKWYVYVAGRKLGVSLWRVLIHDWSKFTPAEWGPYARYFYIDQEEYHDQFQQAWLHHLRNNKHHWQAWVLLNDDGTIVALSMPKTYIREMVADWAGAGRAITGEWEVRRWYDTNSSLMRMSPGTRFFVERLLEEFRPSVKR